jgi:DNA polymerase-1
MILKIIREKKPDYMAVVFDAKGPTFRHKESPTYKANRPPMPDDLFQQIPYIKEIIEALGIVSLEQEGYEADDIIAALCEKFGNEDVEIILVSGDKDLRQLISPKIKLWDSMQDRLLEETDILERYKLSPFQLKEVMALAGDKIDNILGVPGVGEKTAIKLIQTFGSLDKLLNNIDKIKPKALKQKLADFKDQILINLNLVGLNDYFPLKLKLQDLSLKEKNREVLIKLFSELEFKRLLKELLPAYMPSVAEYHLVLEKKTLEKLIERIKKGKMFVLDLKTSSSDALLAEPIGLCFCCKQGEAWYVPVGHFYFGVPPQLPLNNVLEALKEVLEDKNLLKIGHNIKDNLIILRNYGIELRGIFFDTMVAAHVLNPKKTNYNLDELAQIYLNIKKEGYKDIIFEGNKKIAFFQLPLEVAKDYVCKDVDIILKLKRIFSEKLKEAGQEGLFHGIEMPLVPVLAEMEWWGVKVDTNYLNKCSLVFAQRLKALEREIFKLAGEGFNINSPAQLRYILFEKLHLPGAKRTKSRTNYSTDVEVLTNLALTHPLARDILHYRTLMKLKSSYIDALPKMVNLKTSCIHTSYNQAGTATGRLSSSSPNLQNIPTRGEEGKNIRGAFIPESGWVYLAADYSQIELRLVTHFCKDATLLKLFHQGGDVHTHTASEIFQVEPTLVTEEMRRQAKVINFGIIYGMSPYGVSKELGIDVSIAKKYIEQYFRRYPGVKAYIEDSLNKARRNSYIETFFKHKRFIPEINSKNTILRKAAERVAINTPIQGTAAEIIKLAMIHLWDAIKAQHLRAKMIMQVHDELIFESPLLEVETLKTLVKDKMERIVTLEVPLKVRIKVGRNWAEVS